MSTPAIVIEIPVPDDDQLLDFTQRERLKLAKLMAEANSTEKGDRMVFLAALGDIDKQALAKKKIGSDEKKGAEDRRVAMAIAELSNRYGSNSPFQPATPAGPRELPKLEGPELEPLTMVPGVVAQGIEVETHDAFVKRMEEGGTLPK